MIFLPVEEAFAFDYLAILEVKQEQGLPASDRENAAQFISFQLTPTTAKKVLDSSEYRELKAANRAVFNLVEKAKYNLCSARSVDKANHVRFTAKKKLQARFFGELQEAKTDRPYGTH